MTPTRRALLAIGVGTVALSLVLSIAPALAKNTNSGTVKIHDGTSGQEQSNDPQVCSFWVEFESAATPETGSWELWSWPPDEKALFTSGAYSTGPGGQSATEVLTPPAGHYRFEWQSSEPANSDSKTLKVVDCTVTPEGATATPTPTATPSESETTPETAAATPTPTPTATPSESETTPESAAATPTATPSESETTPESAAATPTATPSESETTPESAAATPTATPSEDPAQAEPSSTPEGEVLAGNPEGTPSSLPNTSTGFETSGLLAALGILLIVGAHAHTRRSGYPGRV